MIDTSKTEKNIYLSLSNCNPLKCNLGIIEGQMVPLQ